MRMVTDERSSARTLLEWLIQRSDRTIEEHCEDFQRCADVMGERGATLSMRQLGRWMAGQVDSARPASRRVAKELWGHSFRELLEAPSVDLADLADLARVAGVAGQVGAAGMAMRVDRAGVRVDRVDQVTGSRGDVDRSRLREEIENSTHGAARFVRRAGVSVSTELIEQLDADVRSLAVEYLRRPPHVVFRPLAILRSDIFEVIDRYPRLEFMRDIYCIAGRASAMLAHVCSDVGHPGAADVHARTAWICADLSADAALRAYVRWIQSNVCYWRSDYVSAAAFARLGRSASVGGDDDLRLVSQEARAAAAAGDERGSVRALGQAADIRDRLVGQPPNQPGVFYFGAGKAAYYSSETRLALGGSDNLRRAITDAEESLQILNVRSDSKSVELIAAARLDLVSALLAGGHLEASVEQMRPALAISAESRTVPVVRRMSGVSRMLADKYGGVALAEDLREQIDLFAAYPAARALPEIADSEV